MKLFRVILPILIIAALAPQFTGCISDSFTTSPNDVLSFSSDTVNFDTVFTDLGTPTARLKVYNRAKKSVNISSIKFAGSQDIFSMNVDGVSGKEFSDVEIRGGDSIFIFVECYIPEQDINTPVLVEDRLQFVTNGVTQDVLLQAYGQNVTRLKGVTVEKDMTLSAEIPYVVFDSLKVAEGATLTIEPGANILFHDGAKVTVDGTIKAVGQPGRMINLRGDRLDNVLPDVSYDILAGQWDGLYISPKSFGNRLEYVDMRSTKEGLVVDSCGNLERRKLLLVNSWLHNSQGRSLISHYAWVDAFGCVFSEAAQSVVMLVGGKHEFTQCTFSNYYLFSIPSDPLLTIQHCLPSSLEANPYNPLMAANFRNCIFFGMPDDVSREASDLTGSEVYFEFCSFKTNVTEDEHTIQCVGDTDPLFMTVRSDYYFNYHVQDDSPVIGIGNPSYVTNTCLIDMDGFNRLTSTPSGTPTLGAYATSEPAQEE